MSAGCKQVSIKRIMSRTSFVATGAILWLYDRMLSHRWFRVVMSLLLTGGVNTFIDFVLYPVAIYCLGLFGGCLMAGITYMFDRYCLTVYSTSGVDWFGLSELQKFRNDDGQTRFVRAILKVWDFLVFLVLSSWKNPFFATVYFRKIQLEARSLTRGDWVWFYISFVISQVIWISVIAYGIKHLDSLGSFLKLLWDLRNLVMDHVSKLLEPLFL